MKVEFGKVANTGTTPKITPLNKDSQVSFKGTYSSAAIANKIDSYMPKSVQTVNKLADSLGEVQNTMINAIGTGAIAPIFIKFNPLSKSDEDTRTYAAWRQPVSAILSVLTNVYLTVKPFDKAMATMVNKGVLGDDYNKTAFKDEEFIAKELKKTNANLSEAEINKQTKEIVQKQTDDMLNYIRNEQTIKINKYNQKGLFNVDKNIFDKAVSDAISDLIESEKLEKKRLQEEKKVYRFRRREFFRTHNKETLTYVSDIEKILNETDLEKVKAALKNKIKDLKGSKDQKELQLITEEILGIARGKIPAGEQSAFIQAMADKLTKVKERAIEYGKMKDSDSVKKAIEQELASRIEAIDKNIEFYTKAQTEIKNGKTVKQIEEMFAQEAKTNCRLKNKNIIFAKRVADTFKRNIKGSIRCNKQFGGLIIGLIAAPFSCELLNITYPLFMDTFFPQLSKSKKKKDAQKLVEQAPVQQQSSKGKEVANG